MAPEKRNHFLDAEDSDDDVQNYDSEDELLKGGRVAKRRKTEDESDYEDGDLNDSAGSENEEEGDGDSNHDPSGEHERTDDEAESENQDSSSHSVKVPQVVKSLTKKNLVATEAAIKKSGVVYLSRVPPFMKPAKLRNLLEPYGKINRLFLAPQDPAAHKKRVKAGGNKKKLYTEGWVEFVRKKDAKRVCDLLNAQTIGGKKGNFYRDDIWTLLYLKGFKWHNLTEQIAAENAERSNRMMAEISRTTKENKEFVRNVEKGKVLEGIKTKRAHKKSVDDDIEGSSELVPMAKTGDKARTFKQVTLAKKDAAIQPSESKSVASRIF
ncbi:RNA-binding ATPase activator esf2 [Gnomoniopsis smithogilvyi]|uniref:18S rRNA factor 2 n=1 Tax=Gnomoniopsis smithogilvyi TaxID=1191159 RepID=A0A9W9CT31_9PEZI|nr:RNA-binding ATPase activator esf2 [Gnomoniopsis smithogilvyi]